MRAQALGPLEVDRDAHGEIAGIELEFRGAAKDLGLPRTHVELDDLGRFSRRASGEHQPRADAAQRRRVVGVRQIDSLEASGLGIQQLETVEPGPGEEAGDAPVAEERVPGQIEDPLGISELGFLAGQRLDLARPLDVEVGPAGSVGDEVQLAGGAPLGLEDRLVLGPCDAAVVQQRSVDTQVGDTEVGAFEGHARMVPGNPRQAHAVGARTWGRIEVAARGDHPRLGGSVGRQDDELVPRLALAVALPDADDQAPVGEDTSVRIPQRVRLRRLWRDRLRLGAGPVDAVELAVVEARAEDDVAVVEPGAPSVLVDPGPHVEVGRDDVDRVAVMRLVNQRGAPLLVRPALRPVDAFLADVEVSELNTTLARYEVGCDR